MFSGNRYNLFPYKYQQGSFTRIFMSIGRKDGLLPPKLLGMINEFTQSRELRVGRIELGDTFTFVEIDTKFVPLFMESFKDKTLNDRPIRVDIAEGQARQSTAEFKNFLSIARGSLAEVETQLLVASRLEYPSLEYLTSIMAVHQEVSKMIPALMGKLVVNR